MPDSSSSTSPADISQWAASGRMDAKGLSKSLPHVAAALRNGQLDPDAVPDMVQQATQHHVLEELRKHIPEIALSKQKVVRLGSLDILTQGEHLLCDLIRVAVGANDDLLYTFAWYVFLGHHQCPWKNVREKTLPFMQDDDAPATVESGMETLLLVREIQQAYNQTCGKMHGEIEKLVNMPIEEHVCA